MGRIVAASPFTVLVSSVWPGSPSPTVNYLSRWPSGSPQIPMCTHTRGSAALGRPPERIQRRPRLRHGTRYVFPARRSRYYEQQPEPFSHPHQHGNSTNGSLSSSSYRIFQRGAFAVTVLLWTGTFCSVRIAWKSVSVCESEAAFQEGKLLLLWSNGSLERKEVVGSRKWTDEEQQSVQGELCAAFSPIRTKHQVFLAAMLATPLMLLVCRLTVYWIIKNSLNENLITFQMNFNAFQSEIFKHVLSLLFHCLSIHTRINVHEFVTCVPHARINRENLGISTISNVQ